MDGLYSGESIAAVIMVTGILGGGAAWLSGRAIARIWHPAWQVVMVALLLAGAARFLHYALFAGHLNSFTSFCLDALIFAIVGLAGWRMTRAAQMVQQYPWLYARSGPLNWREIGQETKP